MEQVLLSLKQVCEYTGWSESAARRVARNPKNKFIVRLGNKIFFHKKMFDEYLDKCAKYSISVS